MGGVKVGRVDEPVRDKPTADEMEKSDVSFVVPEPRMPY